MNRSSWIFPGLFVLVGASFAVYGLAEFERARRTALWPGVPGTITKSRVSGFGDNCDPDVAYVYSVGGVKYQRTGITSGLRFSSGSDVDARRLIARYPLASQVIVFYDPDDPSEGLLEPGVSRRSFAPIVFGLMFASIGGSFFYVGRKDGRMLVATCCFMATFVGLFGLFWWLCSGD